MLGMRTLSQLSSAFVLSRKRSAEDSRKSCVVAMFERGADTGDEPGEYQYWVEREKLDA